MKAYIIFIVCLLFLFTANSSPVLSTELPDSAHSILSLAPLTNLLEYVRGAEADTLELASTLSQYKDRLVNSSMRTRYSALANSKTVANLKNSSTINQRQASKFFSHLLSDAEEWSEIDSKLSLLWLKLANTILPYQETIEQSKVQWKKAKLGSKKFSIDQGQLIRNNDVRSPNVMKVGEVPSHEHMVKHHNSSNSFDLEVNLSGLLSKFFGKPASEPCEEEEEEEEVLQQDSCDDSESEDCDSDCEGYYSDRYGYYDPCFYESSTGKLFNSTSHGNHTHNRTSHGHTHKHTHRNHTRGSKRNFTLSSLPNYSNILQVLKLTSFGSSRFNYNGISGLVIGLLAAIIFA